MNLRESSLIVLEGPDGSGKSTQVKRLTNIFYDSDPKVHFTHQPSGECDFTRTMYRMLEQDQPPITDPLAKQLIHLACHAEHYRQFIRPALNRGESVIMDRCWWSAYAYGSEAQSQYRVHNRQWQDLVRMPTNGLNPDVIFLFMDEHVKDPRNSPAVFTRYLALLGDTNVNGIDRDGMLKCIKLPLRMKPEEATNFIIERLEARGLVV